MEDPMQFLYHAAYLNEKGSGLMKAGKQHEAFETFIAAVESINTVSQWIEANQYHQHRTLSSLTNSRRRKQSCDWNPMTSNCIIENFGEKLADANTTTTTCGNDSIEHNNFVYNQAFRFAPRELGATFDDPTLLHYIKLYRAILTFNSALTFHQRSTGANERLRRTAESVASNLYLDAIHLLQDCFSTLDSCRVLAATLNNAAMLYYERQEFGHFESFQNELHRLLIDMETSFPKSVDPRCLRCLFFNATLLSAPRTAGAA